MTSSRISLSKNPRDPEDIILEHYRWLLDWAHQLTRGTSEEAEDLVQDLCVRLMRMKTQPELLDEDLTRAYLYKALRNLFLSKRLRHGRDAISGLLVVDFDSVSWAVSAVDRNKLLYVRSDLARICEYACIRRKSSGAAAALILRFFIGYLPTEAMAILKSKRTRIDALTQTSRLEAKAYLERPNVLRFLDRSDKKPQTASKNLPEDSDALFTELLRRIFAEPEGQCFPLGVLEDRYTHSLSSPFSIEEIAHLVSCRSCLHLATEILALPDLTLQFFPDASGSGEAGPPAARSEKTDLKKLRRKLRETYEHRPSKLQILVDGVVRGVQSITGVSSKVQIALEPLSEPGFVEILSEQGLGLLYLDLHPDQTELPNTQQADVELSDGRQLSVALTLSEGVPVIHVSYYDPLFEAEGNEPPSSRAEANASVAFSDWENLRRHTSLRDRIRNRLRGWWRPTGISFVIASLVVAAILGPFRRSEVKKTPLNAQTLLSLSNDRVALAVPTHGAVRSRFSLEVTGQNQHRHLEVDALRSAERPLQVLRLRTSDGTLVAADEVDAAGREHKLSSNAARPGPDMGVREVSANGMWQYPPDAQIFLKLAAGADTMSVREMGGRYEVGFRRAGVENQSTIVEANLEIEAESMRPVAETLELQEGDSKQEYRFRELAYEVLPASKVHDADFRLEEATYNKPVSTMQDAEARCDAPQLTLAVLELLSKQQQQVQDSVDVERDENGKVSVTGVLQSTADKQLLIRALSRLAGSPALTLDLHVLGEHPTSPLATKPVVVDSPLSIAAGPPPLDALLRGPLASRGIQGPQLDVHVHRLADVLVNSGAQLHREAWVAEEIATKDFRPQELKTMRVDARARWLALLKLHLDRCAKELDAITGVLPLNHYSDDEVRASRAPQPFPDAAEFRNGLGRLVQTSTKLETALTSGFALSPESHSPSATPAELEELITNLQAEESRLEATIDRLYRTAP